MSDNYDIISFNKQYVHVGEFNLGIENRGFKYGDGFFETMHANGAQVQFIESHFERVRNSCKILKMNLPDYFTATYFSQQISGLLTRKKLFQAARVRATFVRKTGGLYKPNSHELDIYRFTIQHFSNL